MSTSSILSAVIIGFSAIALAACTASATSSSGSATFGEKSDNPVELGDVSWNRDFAQGSEAAKKQSKPRAVLFQEIPGCQTCQDFGQNPLSHPLIVDVLENEFVPICVKNNSSGDADAEVRKRFKEPSWNNPVFRFLPPDTDRDLIPRVGDFKGRANVANEIGSAIRAAKREVPTYYSLYLLEKNARKNGTETAFFAMPCYWSGEAGFGRIDGVVETESGWSGSREVVRVVYDPKTISYAELAKQAKKVTPSHHACPLTDDQEKFASGVFGKEVTKIKASSFRPVKDTKYQLRRTSLKYLPMTRAQATRVNANPAAAKSSGVLSPSQLALLETIEKNPKAGWNDVVDQDFVKSWKAVTAQAATLRKKERSVEE